MLIGYVTSLVDDNPVCLSLELKPYFESPSFGGIIKYY